MSSWTFLTPCPEMASLSLTAPSLVRASTSVSPPSDSSLFLSSWYLAVMAACSFRIFLSAFSSVSRCSISASSCSVVRASIASNLALNLVNW